MYGYGLLLEKEPVCQGYQVNLDYFQFAKIYFLENCDKV